MSNHCSLNIHNPFEEKYFKSFLAYRGVGIGLLE
jgi:hypothetical protein